MVGVGVVVSEINHSLARFSLCVCGVGKKRRPGGQARKFGVNRKRKGDVTFFDRGKKNSNKIDGSTNIHLPAFAAAAPAATAARAPPPRDGTGAAIRGGGGAAGTAAPVVAAAAAARAAARAAGWAAEWASRAARAEKWGVGSTAAGGAAIPPDAATGSNADGIEDDRVNVVSAAPEEEEGREGAAAAARAAAAPAPGAGVSGVAAAAPPPSLL